MSNDFRCWAASHVGRVRENNEDAYFASSMPRPMREPAWSGEVHRHSGWAIIADGVGGHAAGEIASRMALDHLGKQLGSCQSDQELHDALAATHRQVRGAARNRPERYQMATTVAGLIFRGTTVVAFNVGDSRAYMYRRGLLRQLSQDHALDGYMLTRCIGGTDAEPPESHILHVKPRIETRFLLCTDGISDELGDEAIQAILTTSHDPAHEIVSAAVVAGGRDNATAVVVDYRR